MAATTIPTPALLTRTPALECVRAWVAGHPWETALGTTMLAALAIRLVNLGSLPDNVTADEADNLQVIFKIVTGHGPSFFGLDWTGLPAFSTYVQASVMTVFGWTIAAMRLSSAVLTTLALLPFFAVARRVTGPLAALLGAVLLATNPWWLNFSRSGWENAWTGLYLLGWLYFTLRGFETRQRRYFVLAGLFGALCLYGYFAGWLIVPIVLLSGVVSWIVSPPPVTDEAVSASLPRRRVLANVVLFAITLGVMLVLYLPQANTMLHQSGSATQRISAVSTVGPGEPTGLQQYTQSALVTFKAFVLDSPNVSFNARYNEIGSGLYNPITAVLLWIGLLAGLVRWRATAYWWVVLLAGLAPTQVLTRGAPDGARSVAFAPFLFLFVALGIGTLLRLRHVSLPAQVAEYRRWLPAVLGLLVLAAAVANVREYVAWMQRPEVLSARQPAVDPADFNTWMNAQLADIRAGRGGFNVGQWLSDRNAMLARAGLPPAPPPAVNSTAPAPAAPAPAQANTRVPLLPVAEGLAAPSGTPGLVIAPTGADAFKNPASVAVDNAGNVYVSDPDSARVLKFDPSGTLVQQIGSKGDGEGQYQQPFDLALDAQGRLYVLDSQRGLMLRYGPDGQYQDTLLNGQGTYSPRGLAIDQAGNVYVADTGRSRVIELSPTNQLIRAIAGATDDQPFDQPTGVAVDTAGDLYVTLPTQKKLVKLAPDGHLLAQRALDPSNTRDAPHLAFAPSGRLIVTESGSARVSTLDPDTLSRVAVLADTSNGLQWPVGVAVDTQGRAYVVDAGKADVLRLDRTQP